LEKLIQSIKVWFHKLSAGQKRHLVIVCTVVFSLFLTSSVIIPMMGKDDEIPAQPERMNINLPIPAGELFLPDEPDFIPGIILQRDRRTSWTEEDAAEHWQNPLRFGEEQWREKIESTINEFLERIP
jgi:hypothetical protein